MWNQLVTPNSDSEELQTFLSEFYEPRLFAALFLAEKGDSEGFGIHQHRYNAKRALHALLNELISYRKDKTFGGSSVVDVVFTLAICNVMIQMGKISFDAAETLIGYKLVEVAKKHLEELHTTGRPMGAEAVKGLNDEITAATAQHVAGRASALNTAKEANARVSLAGSGLLLDAYLFMAMAWSRWADNDNAMVFLGAHELLKSLWDTRQATQAREDKAKQMETLMATAEAENKAREQAQASDQAAVNAALEAKLAAKRAKRKGSPQSASSGEQQAPAREAPSSGAGGQAQQPTAASAVRDIPALSWAHCQAFTNTDVLHRLHFCGLEKDDAMAILTSKAASCSAQVLKSQESAISSSMYCHRSLVDRARVLFTSPPHEVSEWIRACSSLVEWYLLVMDLSHAEHCLAAIEEILKQAEQKAPNLFAALEVDRTALNFNWATLVYNMMKLSQLTINTYDNPGDAVFAQLYLNPLLPPEELRNAPESARPAQPDWSFPDRLPLPITGLAPPRKDMIVRTTTMEDLHQLYTRMSQYLESIRSEIAVDVDCERFLQSQRMEADALEVLFDFSDEPIFLQNRIAVLQRIYAVELNPNAFRNVLRQADYDIGSSAQKLANHFATEKPGSAEVQVYREEALKYFKQFVAGFHREIDLAKKQEKGANDVLDKSDFPALVIGEMQVASLLKSLGHNTEALTVYQSTIQFLNNHPEALRDYPDLREMREQCVQLLELMGGKAPTGTRRLTPTRDGVAPKQATAKKAAANPSSRVMAKPRPAPKK